MSMEIGGIGPAQVPGVQPVSAPAPPAVGSAESIPHDDAVTVDVQSLPENLPPEVSAAIATASQAYDKLAAEGKHVQFSVDPQTGDLNIQMHGTDGSSQQLSGSEALRLAGGESLG